MKFSRAEPNSTEETSLQGDLAEHRLAIAQTKLAATHCRAKRASKVVPLLLLKLAKRKSLWSFLIQFSPTSGRRPLKLNFSPHSLKLALFKVSSNCDEPSANEMHSLSRCLSGLTRSSASNQLHSGTPSLVHHQDLALRVKISEAHYELTGRHKQPPNRALSLSLSQRKEWAKDKSNSRGKAKLTSTTKCSPTFANIIPKLLVV